MNTDDTVEPLNKKNSCKNVEKVKKVFYPTTDNVLTNKQSREEIEINK